MLLNIASLQALRDVRRLVTVIREKPVQTDRMHGVQEMDRENRG